jgi:uncharacterized protein YkwD
MRPTVCLSALSAAVALADIVLSTSPGWGVTDGRMMIPETRRDNPPAALRRWLAPRVSRPNTVPLSNSTCTCSPDTTTIDPGSYRHSVLYSHNIHRANHSSPDLTWSADLEGSARTLATRCIYQHDTYNHPLPTAKAHAK